MLAAAWTRNPVTWRGSRKKGGDRGTEAGRRCEGEKLMNLARMAGSGCLPPCLCKLAKYYLIVTAPWGSFARASLPRQVGTGPTIAMYLGRHLARC